MEKKYLKLNTLFCVLLLGLISWAFVNITMYGNPYSGLYALFFGILSFFYLVHLLISYLVILNKKYKLLINYNKDSKYSYEIINYNYLYCNNIIASCAIIGDFLLNVFFISFSSVANFEAIKISNIVIFTICLIAAILPTLYKYIQLNKYVKETNKVAKLIKEGKLG